MGHLLASWGTSTGQSAASLLQGALLRLTNFLVEFMGPVRLNAEVVLAPDWERLLGAASLVFHTCPERPAPFPDHVENTN